MCVKDLAPASFLYSVSVLLYGPSLLPGHCLYDLTPSPPKLPGEGLTISP